MLFLIKTSFLEYLGNIIELTVGSI